MTLTRTWLLLVLLTLAALLIGHPAGQEPLGALAVAGVLLASGVKAVQILRNFLGLRHAGTGWQAVFILYLALVATAILGAYMMAGSGMLARAH
ncbi:MAG: cytochrome C oxidase subunit IV family protein [Acetobacteraceae bacterium]|nr:cytochrome C oxidase subunit IV family protein [Acetobacteraceae bacterium]MDI3308004.1 cytochrome C oxidase subunit IV family protein [Acetobacteraceae bacterium]